MSKSQIRTAKAYSSIPSTASKSPFIKEPRFPNKDFDTVTNAELNKKEYDTLIMQAGSVDITNLVTSTKTSENAEFFKQRITVSAKNLFSTATRALSNHPELKKVVIMTMIPRYDKNEEDPHKLKPALSNVFNAELFQTWLNSPLKHKIFIGSHELECSGGIREARYGNLRHPRHDCIHMVGVSGCNAYTKSVINILKTASVIPSHVSTDIPASSSSSEYHKTCPQTRYQQEKHSSTTNSSNSLNY